VAVESAEEGMCQHALEVEHLDLVITDMMTIPRVRDTGFVFPVNQRKAWECLGVNVSVCGFNCKTLSIIE
jgi:hypothetical protein